MFLDSNFIFFCVAIIFCFIKNHNLIEFLSLHLCFVYNVNNYHLLHNCSTYSISF